MKFNAVKRILLFLSAHIKDAKLNCTANLSIRLA